MKGTEQLNVQSYTYFGSNREVRNIRVSGGIGILAKDTLFNSYHVNKYFVLNDNVLGLKLEGKVNVTSDVIVIYCVYLLPENSKYGQQTENILNSLTVDIYQNSEADSILICGDFNVRTGNLDDCLDVDNVEKRINVDENVNSQGHKLLNFVSDIKGCIVNGHVTPQLNGYTSCTEYRGRAVVDYCIVRQTELRYIKEMSVTSCYDIIANKNISHLISDNCHVPDHSLLQMSAETSGIVRAGLNDQNLGSINFSRNKIVRKVGDSYMSSEIAKCLLPTLLNDLENNIKNQEQVNEEYDKVTTFILNEAGRLNENKRK